ncbi:hypothetical protein ACE7GA_05870 [Roseomonas sp. CCTCC AB2023176]|uniref:hypothetical protein n=1 Tax=Roseomonas sp. CCTCC AB2023176 TaxID=3342640 RepID=UPI0035DD1521
MPDLATLTFAGVPFEVRIDPARPAYFLYGIRKSGSSIMNAMVTSLARMNDVHYVDVAGRLFEKGVGVGTWQKDPGLGDLIRGGNVYGGFRNAPLGIKDHPVARASRSVLLVRDPRDALVSEYFSNAYSHSIPPEGEARDQMLQQRADALRASIAEYVLRMAPNFRNTLREYIPFLQHPHLRLYQYERAILDKRWFLRDLCDHYGWSVSDTQLGHILGWADVMPEEENPTQFVRKVRPGDHLDKLDPATIARLNEILGDGLRLLRYDA